MFNLFQLLDFSVHRYFGSKEEVGHQVLGVNWCPDNSSCPHYQYPAHPASDRGLLYQWHVLSVSCVCVCMCVCVCVCVCVVQINGSFVECSHQLHG